MSRMSRTYDRAERGKIVIKVSDGKHEEWTVDEFVQAMMIRDADGAFIDYDADTIGWMMGCSDREAFYESLAEWDVSKDLADLVSRFLEKSEQGLYGDLTEFER